MYISKTQSNQRARNTSTSSTLYFRPL